MRLLALVLAAAALLSSAAGGGAAAPDSAPAPVTVTLGPQVNAVRADAAFGAGLDGAQRGDMAGVYTRPNLVAMRSAGLPQVAYRLRTELGSEAWHPTGAGRFSEGDRGYWTSSVRPRGRVLISNGYRLPRRGNTIDQANDDGYSRIDDGSRATFWKSNPYLDPVVAHERHDQWVMVDLGHVRRVDALRVAWGRPFARRLRVEAWTGAIPPAPYGRERENAIFSSGLPPGRWHALGGVRRGRAGTQLVRFAPRAVAARWVRLVLMAGSHTAPPGAHDLRDRLGYAIRELWLGRLRGRRLVDLMRHGASNTRQSIVWVSSTDPWHRARDRDTNTEQPGFDRVWASGLTRGRPVLMPVSVLYGTPADAVAQLRFLRARGYPVRQVELGEEPDGQMMQPEDYGALYLRFARALHRFDPRLELGGPGFSTALPDWSAWPDRSGSRSFTGRFVRYLRRHRALALLGFFSFEWYPVDDVCAPVAQQLLAAPQNLAAVIARQRRDGLPRRIPLVITEFGYSAFAAQPEVELAGAISDADTVGGFLALGGAQAFLYGLEPQNVMQESTYCRTVGNLTLFKSDDAHRIQHPVAAYWATRLIDREWLQPEHGVQRVRSAVSSDAAVGAYALARSDGRLSLLLVNRDPARARAVSVAPALHCALDVYRLSPAEYVWHPRGAYPSPDGPPRHDIVAGGTVTLPPSTVAVARTTVAASRCGAAGAG